MQCTSPVLIRLPDITGGKSFSGRFAERNGKPYGMYVPCGKCMGCRIAKTREWTIRLLHEKETCGSTSFITLTYDNEHLPEDVGLHKDHLQRFFKRFRKDISKKIRYFACGEYGDRFGRPHYHAIILGWEPPISDLVYIAHHGGRKYYSSGYLTDKWPFGFNIVGTVTKESCQYVTGYIRKKLNGALGKERYGTLQPPFQLQSRGIGYNYALSQVEHIVKEGTIDTHFGQSSLPRYYRRKMEEAGIIDLKDKYKEAAVAAEHIVHDFYAAAGLCEHDILLETKAAYVMKDLSNKRHAQYSAGGQSEDYV